MNIANSVSKKVHKDRAKKLARGNIFIQKGLFYTDDEWKTKKSENASNIKFLNDFFNKHARK